MLDARAKELIERLELPYPAIAVKFSYSCPEGIERFEGKGALCSMIKQAQVLNRPFYIDDANENCVGGFVLGMRQFDGFPKSGGLGFEHGIFRSPAANARLYYEIETIKEDTCHYVTFCPTLQCDFNPDLVFMVAEVPQAQRIIRAANYVTNDPWESKATYVLSCSWLFAYPYITGKINHVVTGMHFGLARQKVYPQGLQIIVIPYQKLDEFVTGMKEMEWDLLCFQEDEESKAIVQAYYDKVHACEGHPEHPVPLDERCRTAHTGA